MQGKKATNEHELARMFFRHRWTQIKSVRYGCTQHTAPRNVPIAAAPKADVTNKQDESWPVLVAVSEAPLCNVLRNWRATSGKLKRFCSVNRPTVALHSCQLGDRHKQEIRLHEVADGTEHKC